MTRVGSQRHRKKKLTSYNHETFRDGECFETTVTLIEESLSNKLECSGSYFVC